MLKQCLLLAALIGVVAVRTGAVPPATQNEGTADFSAAVIVAPADISPVQQKAMTVLREEIEKRTGIELKQVSEWPQSAAPVIAVGLQDRQGYSPDRLPANSRRNRFPGPKDSLSPCSSSRDPRSYLRERQPRAAV